jgi:hypothetical protein
VRSFVARHSTEIIEQFELVLNTVSMEEAVEQADRQELMRPEDESVNAEPVQQEKVRREPDNVERSCGPSVSDPRQDQNTVRARNGGSQCAARPASF